MTGTKLPAKPKPTDNAIMHTDVTQIAARCHTVEDFLQSMKLGDHEIACIEESTREQSDSAMWKTVRFGRLTASNFYRVYTRIETLKSAPTADMSKLVHSFLNPPDIAHLPQIARGKALESQAVETLLDCLKKRHKNVVFIQCGFFIDSKMPYIGATPDGIISCECHGKSLIEVKCPTSDLSVLQYLENGKLKAKSGYYGQVQGQMLVTKIPSC